MGCAEISQLTTLHRTRIAPSPTGALHLGNARTFLVNWALARQNGWEILLRIEDLDGPRIKRGAAEQAIDLLGWLGIDWDVGPIYQSDDLSPYQQAMSRLATAGDAFVCKCTRREIEAASRSAPHGEDHELRYHGTCRPAAATSVAAEEVDLASSGWRLRAPEGEQAFVDQFAGPQSIDVNATVGDFQVWTKGGLPSYQLAVVVDDARQRIDRVIRGDDLLGSTPRQVVLYERLGLAPTPEYWHLPLVRGEDGRRLAKRHGDTRLAQYRSQGVGPERVIGLLAAWSGMGGSCPMTAKEFAAAFRLGDLPHNDVVFRASDDAWLLTK